MVPVGKWLKVAAGWLWAAACVAMFFVAMTLLHMFLAQHGLGWIEEQGQ